LGGIVMVTGIETGTARLTGGIISATNGAHAVIDEVNGVRKIVEWRESTNFPSEFFRQII